ncbi:hypothetical protein PENTCL1PPCAC_22305, partial [Pristionchus entomophagus]
TQRSFAMALIGKEASASIAMALPLVIKSIFGHNNGEAEKERRKMDADMEKLRIESDLEKMKINLNAMQHCSDRNKEAMAALADSHRETLASVDKANLAREERLQQDARDLRALQITKEQEMRNSSREEREVMRNDMTRLQKAKDEELRAHHAEATRERKEAREEFEKKRAELENAKTILQERMIEQEKHHSAAMLHLTERHGEAIRALQDLRLSDHKEYAASTQSLLREQIENAAMQAIQQTSMIIAHYQARENASLADQLNVFRLQVSNTRSVHLLALQHLESAAIDDCAVSIGQAKGVLQVLRTTLDRLESSRTTVMTAMDKSTSLAIEHRMEQQKFLSAISRPLLSYETCAQKMLGQLSANPPKSISSVDVKEFGIGYNLLTDSVDAIPLLAITDDFANRLVHTGSATKQVPCEFVTLPDAFAHCGFIFALLKSKCMCVFPPFYTLQVPQSSISLSFALSLNHERLVFFESSCIISRYYFPMARMSRGRNSANLLITNSRKRSH